MSSTPSDEQIMQAYQKGEAGAFDAFNELYRRHAGKVYGYLSARERDRQAVDDAFQAVFLKLHQARGQFDPAYRFLPWLFTICRTVLNDGFRKKGRSESVAPAEDAALSEVPSEPAEVAVAADLSLLDGRQRQVLELRYLGDQSFEEIALRIGTTPGNVRQLVSRALRKLRDTR
ncbi:MAG: sigma-70 family RNA polymerase sigma factor [Oligoflexia bacterium]|nr:sigma-70 family RNA polymerase sigma factor [Oligoflexia bacterium]